MKQSGLHFSDTEAIISFLRTNVVDRAGFDAGVVATGNDPFSTSSVEFWQDFGISSERRAQKSYTINPYIFVRQLSDGPAREYHIALIRKFNENADLASIRNMAAILKREAIENPSYWTEITLHWYSLQQSGQILNYVVSHFPGGFTAPNIQKASIYVMGNNPINDEMAAQWREVLQKHSMSEVDAMLSLLRSGIIDQKSFDHVSLNFDLATQAAFILQPSYWEQVKIGLLKEAQASAPLNTAGNGSLPQDSSSGSADENQRRKKKPGFNFRNLIPR